MDLNQIKSIFFVGIGGIGMSAIARYFIKKGIPVFGYDKTETTLTKALTNEGVSIIYQDDLSALPSEFIQSSASSLVVYTPAIPKNNQILDYFKNLNFNLLKRSEVLSILSANHFTIAVAGTHGKTSTTACLAHLLKATQSDFTAFIGGIANNFNSNFVSTSANENSIVVVEADEYDRSFLKLTPNISIITSLEADHLDIYVNEIELIKAYQDFANKTVKDGFLILHESVVSKLVKPNNCKVFTYGNSNHVDFQYHNFRVIDHHYHFDINNLELINGVPGVHNAANATAALFACNLMNLNANKFLKDFTGVKRRFQFIVQNSNNVYIDDYAHHPTELNAAINTTKELYPDLELTVIFQPHLFSRTRDLKEGFINALSSVDKLIVMPIYPAREEPIDGIDASIIADNVKNSIVLNHDECLDYIQKTKPKLLLTLGAGNIDLLINPIKKILSN